MRFQAAKALTFLGFSEIEALVYCFLLEESPATGYRVSHAIGKPTANTYKAIAALALRGAIIIDDSESRLCRAVPPGELLDRLDREFDGHKQTAAAELAKLRPAAGDDRVYYLTSVEQVVERARAMCAAAKQAVLLDVQDRHLRNRRPGGFIRALPPLEVMERLLFQMIATGFALLSAALLTGMLFLEDIFAQHLVHKTVLSIASWVIFGILLWGRWKFGWRGRTAIRWTLSGFVFLILAYFGSKMVLELILQRNA